MYENAIKDSSLNRQEIGVRNRNPVCVEKQLYRQEIGVGNRNCRNVIGTLNNNKGAQQYAYAHASYSLGV